MGYELPSCSTASPQASTVNLFRWYIRDDRLWVVEHVTEKTIYRGEIWRPKN